ncbi:hypothetical protein BC938DRAFT_478135 [Jimgerdemannia flammicorona]|uniref:Cyclin N-terminal domain-containing protein n=1 Tax=Jimgerdemannia flammicorona TaxID=994334 RepID=A0A433QNE4_9FUNG|nr:hypothetical protein BC938DRAFT_478135 [Jimgerdemannia flammicorona]
MAAGEYTKIPLELIDLTATLIATLITGHSYSYFLFGPAITFPSSPTRSHSPTSNSFHATLHHDVAFIRRVLRRAQISCTELILSLFYIDRFFHATKERQGGLRRKSRLDGAESSSSSSGSEIEAESGTESASGEGEGKSGKADGWSTRDLFMASIVVADKFLWVLFSFPPFPARMHFVFIADATWPNKEWSVSTSSHYTPSDLTHLERRFLTSLDYRLFVTEQQYRDFVAYLEVLLHLNELLRRGFSSALSYKDVRVLSQYILPAYMKRLRMNPLRPIQAMLLVAGYTAAIYMVYVAGLAIVAAVGWVVREAWARVVREQVVAWWRWWMWAQEKAAVQGWVWSGHPAGWGVGLVEGAMGGAVYARNVAGLECVVQREIVLSAVGDVNIGLGVEE